MAVGLREYRDDDLALTLALETDPVVMRHLGGPRSRADLERVRERDDIDALHAFPPEANAPSIRLCEKFGFSDHGVSEFTFAGHPLRCHHYVFALDR